MISKKTFCDTLLRMEELQVAEDTINKVFLSVGSQFNQFSLDDALTLVLKVLVEAMEDEDEWIIHYVFDMDYGKNFGEADEMIPIDKFGNIVPMKTAEELYEYLVDMSTDEGFI